MKKTFANIRTLAAVLMTSAALVACNKEYNATAEQTPQVYTLAIQAGMDSNAQTKALELNGTKLVAKWAAGDELTVINVTSGTPLGGTLTASNVSADGQTCTFSGTLTGAIAVDNQLALHYHAISGTQDGTLVSAAANDHAFANVTVASVEAGNITISGGTATFNTTTAVLKLTLKDGSANALNATSLKMTVDGVDIFTASPTAATYTANGNGVLYFAVPRQIEAAEKIVVEKSGGHPTEELLNTWMTYLNTYTVTFSATVGSDTYTATKTGYKLAAGKYYATELTMAKVKPDLLSGVFTVAAGKTVKFSKGNLQYTKSTSTWSFMENQYSTVETSGQNVGTDYANQDVVSLFGWGTSGWSNGNAFYQPYNTSYGTTGIYTSAKGYGYGPTDGSTYNFSLTGVYANADWGARIGSGWRTLTGGLGGEWEYLFNTRSASTVNGTANARYAKAKVCNVQGVILFPDTYSHPSGVTAPAGINATNDTGWNGNNYDATAWSAMESAGCVFLPAAGFRSDGTSVGNVGSLGRYWSSTHNETNKAYYMRFASSSVDLADSSVRFNGYSVRLVQDAN